MKLKNVFLAHAPADRDFACRLSSFLEFGCDVSCSASEGLIPPGRDLLAVAEEGLAADILVLLLSAASWPVRVPRQLWEKILFEETSRAGVEVVSILLGNCLFPPLLRRRNFIDGTVAPLPAMRLLKRWLWRRETGTAQLPVLDFTSDLEDLYTAIADCAGTLKTSGEDASRFVREAGQEFATVLWIPCHRRSLAAIAGDLGAQLAMSLEGTVEENCRAIHQLLATRRCLLVLDAPSPELAPQLIAGGRTSTLVTQDPVKVVETPKTLAHARKLLASHRYAEAYELFHHLLDSGISPPECARELSWICEQWNQLEEAESLRFHFRLPPTDQLALF